MIKDTEEIPSELSSFVGQLKAQGFSRVCFMLPAYNVGGGTWELCQIAIFLAEHTDLEVFYMDYNNGYPSFLLAGSRVKIVAYKDEDSNFCIEEPCVVITNLTRVVLLKNMNPTNKILFWHYETAPVDWNALFLLNETNRFLQLCSKSNSVMFHDWSAWNILETQSGLQFQRNYLWVVIPRKPPNKLPREMVHPDEIHVVCLGRLGYEKIQGLYKVMDLFAAHSTRKKKVLHIVGDGKYRRQAERYSEKFRNVLTVEFTGTIPKDELDQYLLTYGDVVFAMGMSTLEGAALHIPSVVIPVSTKPIDGDWFYFLYDTKDYCVGILPEQKDAFDVHFHTFSEIIDAICCRGGKKKTGDKCYRYYAARYASLEAVAAKCVRGCVDSRLTMEMVRDCIQYIPYNHLAVKEINFLGIKKEIPIWNE